MTDNTVEKMLDNKRMYESGNYNTTRRNDRTKVQSPDSIRWLKETPHCPNVVVANISQDHWKWCKRGPIPPIEKENGHHTWTGIPGPIPDYLSKGSVLLARRTIRRSDGTTGSAEHGVMGVWLLKRWEPVKSNSDHPWNKPYSWYLHCTSIETGLEVIYHESWQKLDIKFTGMTGAAVFKLKKHQQVRYLQELISEGDLADSTERYLKTLIECKIE